MLVWRLLKMYKEYKQMMLCFGMALICSIGLVINRFYFKGIVIITVILCFLFYMLFRIFLDLDRTIHLEKHKDEFH